MPSKSSPQYCWNQTNINKILSSNFWFPWRPEQALAPRHQFGIITKERIQFRGRDGSNPNALWYGQRRNILMLVSTEIIPDGSKVKVTSVSKNCCALPLNVNAVACTSWVLRSRKNPSSIYLRVCVQLVAIFSTCKNDYAYIHTET